MAFPFYCPQGHLLQGEPEQAGQPCQCPQCGSTFLVPQANVAGPVGDLAMPAFDIPPPGSNAAPSRGGDLPMPAFDISPPGSNGAPARGGDLAMPAFDIPPPGTPAPAPAMTAHSAPMPQPRYEVLPPQPAPAPMPPGPMQQWPAPQAPMRQAPVQQPLPRAEPLPPMAPRALDLPPQPALAAPPVASLPPPPEADESSFGGLGFDPLAKAALPFELPDAEPIRGLQRPAPSQFFDLTASAPPASTPMNDAAADLPSGGAETAAETSPLEFLDGVTQPEADAVPVSSGEAVLHVLCPSGHPLETAREMLGKTAICPLCKKQFQLKYERSVEFRRKQQIRREREEEELGRHGSCGRLWPPSWWPSA